MVEDIVQEFTMVYIWSITKVLYSYVHNFYLFDSVISLIHRTKFPHPLRSSLILIFEFMIVDRIRI